MVNNAHECDLHAKRKDSPLEGISSVLFQQLHLLGSLDMVRLEQLTVRIVAYLDVFLLRGQPTPLLVQVETLSPRILYFFGAPPVLQNIVQTRKHTHSKLDDAADADDW